MTPLPTMTGVDLYDFMDRLRLKAEQMSRQWREAVNEPVAHPLPLETYEANAQKWAKIAEIFKDTRSRIYNAAESEFKEESCGA